jgi:DNA-binding GntR family transcriptional regulator
MQVKHKYSLPLTKNNLRREARAVLRQQLLEGRLAGRLNESELSVRLGISRTPLREALLGLEKEGLVVAEAGKGFSAAPLSAQEASEVYPILWTLECLALRLRGVPTADELEAFAQINDRLESKLHQPAVALQLDTEWHTALLSACTNTRLKESIRHLKQLAYRYEYAYMQKARRVIASVSQHRRILAALKKDDMDRAVAMLEENWRVTLDVAGSWLAKKTDAAETISAAASPAAM